MHGPLHEVGQLLLVEILYDFAHVLRLFARGDQQCVLGLHDDEVVHSHHRDKLFGMHKVARRLQCEILLRRNYVLQLRLRRCAVLIERSPRTQIVPAKVGGNAIDSRCPFAFLRARLQNGVIDADAFAFRIKLGKLGVEVRRAIARGNLFEKRSRLRQVLAQRVGQRPRAPHEHTAVPEVIARLHKLLDNFLLWFLDEPPHREALLRQLLSHFDVAVPCLGPRRRNPHHNDVRPAPRNLDRALDVCTKPRFVLYHVVRRKHSNDRARIGPRQDERRQPNCRRGVPPNRLGQHLVGVEHGKLFQNRRAQVVIGDDPKILVRRERLQPLHRFLDHALRTIERQQLLGLTFAAERPEPRAAAAGQYHWIEILDRCFAQRAPYARGCGLSLDYPSTVCGSATSPVGSDMRITSSSHCGLTEYSGTHAGTTTASPLARLTGSMPADSMTPEPSMATMMCGDANETLPCIGSRSFIFSTSKNGDRNSTLGPPPLLPTTLPALLSSFTAARPSLMCSSRPRP